MNPVPAWFFREQRSRAQECITCHHIKLEHKLTTVQTCRETWGPDGGSPAEYDYQCLDCRDIPDWDPSI